MFHMRVTAGALVLATDDEDDDGGDVCGGNDGATPGDDTAGDAGGGGGGAVDDWPSVMLEEYLDGDEVDVDVVLSKGVARYTFVSDNWPCDEPWFNETGGDPEFTQ